MNEQLANYICEQIAILEGAAKSPMFPTDCDKEWCKGGIAALNELLCNFGWISKVR